MCGGGVKCLWMLGFAVIHGKKIVGGSSLNHTPRACWPLVSKSKLWYEVTTSIKRSYFCRCNSEIRSGSRSLLLSTKNNAILIADATKLHL